MLAPSLLCSGATPALPSLARANPGVSLQLEPDSEHQRHTRGGCQWLAGESPCLTLDATLISKDCRSAEPEQHPACRTISATRSRCAAGVGSASAVGDVFASLGQAPARTCPSRSAPPEQAAATPHSLIDSTPVA